MFRNLMVERIAAPARAQLKRGYGNALSALGTQYGSAQGYLSNTLSNIQSQYQPYVNQGNAAVKSLADLQANPSSITQTPYYQFQAGEGLRLLQQQKAAQGKYFSGETLKAIEQYGQGLASTSYQNEWQRQFNLAQLGQGAMASLAGIEQGIGGAQAQLATGFGENQAGLMASQGRDVAAVEFSAPRESIQDDQGITSLIKSWWGMGGQMGGGGGGSGGK